MAIQLLFIHWKKREVFEEIREKLESYGFELHFIGPNDIGFIGMMAGESDEHKIFPEDNLYIVSKEDWERNNPKLPKLEFKFKD